LRRGISRVSVQDGGIIAIADGAEKAGFLRRRVGEQLQRLIAVTGEHHLIEQHRFAIFEMQGHVAIAARH